jgi:hypothetical protein
LLFVFGWHNQFPRFAFTTCQGCSLPVPRPNAKGPKPLHTERAFKDADHPPPLSGRGYAGLLHIYPDLLRGAYGAGPIAGVRRGDWGPLGLGLCRMLDATFREVIYFQVLG